MEILCIQLSDDAHISISQKIDPSDWFVLQGHTYRSGEIKVMIWCYKPSPESGPVQAESVCVRVCHLQQFQHHHWLQNLTVVLQQLGLQQSRAGHDVQQQRLQHTFTHGPIERAVHRTPRPADEPHRPAEREREQTNTRQSSAHAPKCFRAMLSIISPLHQITKALVEANARVNPTMLRNMKKVHQNRASQRWVCDSLCVLISSSVWNNNNRNINTHIHTHTHTTNQSQNNSKHTPFIWEEAGSVLSSAPLPSDMCCSEPPSTLWTASSVTISMKTGWLTAVAVETGSSCNSDSRARLLVGEGVLWAESRAGLLIEDTSCICTLAHLDFNSQWDAASAHTSLWERAPVSTSCSSSTRSCTHTHTQHS